MKVPRTTPAGPRPKRNPTAVVTAADTKRRRNMEFTETALAKARQKQIRSLDTPMRPNSTAFSIPKPPPGVVPNGTPLFAFDEAEIGAGFNAWIGEYSVNYAWAEGLQFLGYPYLAELMQRPEYRRMVEIIAIEMTREWIKLKSRGEKDKTKKIAQIEAEMRRLGLRDAFKEIAVYDMAMGRSHLYLDTGDTSNRPELQKDIGPGTGSLSKAKVNKENPLLRVKCVEAVWTYPTNYNSNDPLEPTWYAPDMWFVMGKQVSASRLLTFIGRPVPDLLKPAYSFGGLALTQMAKPYVTNWLQTRQSVNDMVSGFSTFKLSTNMAAFLTDEDGATEASLWRRADFFTNFRNNRGLFMVDKNEEDLDNVAAPLSGLDLLQAQSQEHMGAVAGIPLVKLLGIQPAGLNSSSEGEIRVFYDWIKAQQHSLFDVNLTTVLNFIQLSLWGEVDDDIEFEYVPLWALDDKELGEVEKDKALTDQAYVDMGAIAPEEVRARLAGDPDSPYHGINPDDAPNLLLEEEQGIEPVGGKPQPQAAEGEQAMGQKPASAGKGAGGE